MVILNRIYTRTGDRGETALGNGQRLSKADLRIEAYGTVDETNATLGLVRLHTQRPDGEEIADSILARVQNDLFDLGADLCVPETEQPSSNKDAPRALRIIKNQWQQLERDIDLLNENLPPLRSFILPGGVPAAAYLHLARTICRRAERLMVALATTQGEHVNEDALIYINRLSDLLFVLSRWVNHEKNAEILWVPGQHR